MTDKKDPLKNNLTSKIVVRNEPNPGLTYMSDLTIYDEELINGRWIGRYWSSNGFVKREESLEWIKDNVFAPSSTTGIDLHSFGLEISGQSLHFGWELKDIEVKSPENENIKQAIVKLKSTIWPVEVFLYTEIDGTGFLTRWLKIRNMSDKPGALNAVWPWSGLLARIEDWKELLSRDDNDVFSVGYMSERTWGKEGAFVWQPLPSTALRLESRMGKSGHSTPFFIIRNDATGEHIVGGLEWSGDWAVELTCELKGDPAALLGFKIGPVSPAPMRILEPGETVESPKVHMSVMFADLDSSVQAWHKHLRSSVLCSKPKNRELLVCYDHWGYHTQEVSEERLKFDIDIAADIGAEVFVVDAGWYGDKGTDWHATVGDWKIGNRLPNGLEPVFEYAREKGLLCGLWMDAERIGRESKTWKEHSDWLIKRYNGYITAGGDINLINPEVQEWIEEQITGPIERYQLDYFKLDYNTTPFEGGHTQRYGYIENSQWRYYEFIYRLYDKIRKRFPKLIMENCASGGGRNDLGMAKRFHHCLASDWQKLPRSAQILNGMTLALPPERLAYFPGVIEDANNHSDLDTQMRVSISGIFLVSGLCPKRELYNPQQIKSAKHHIEIYKTFIRPFLSTCRVYHHVPVLKKQDWCVLEYVAEDSSRAAISVFRLSGTGNSFYRLYPRGLSLEKRYKITFDNEGSHVEKNGEEIRREGLSIFIDHNLASELILFQAL
jgi:alpha-galactosidase